MQRGTTMVELMVATAILAVVFAAIMPVFAAIRNHADSAGAGSEMVQNARVLNEQLYRYLAQAKGITAMSDGSATDGFIEFETRDGVIRRCQLGSSGYIEFGPVGELCELAGPAEHLTFTCYDGNDPAGETDVPAHVRLVTWEAQLDSVGALTTDKTVRGACYLRVGASSGSAETNASYDFAMGQQGVNCFAYAGQDTPQLPTTVGTPSSPLTSGQYDAIEVQDGSLYVFTVSSSSNYARMRFVFATQEDRSTVTQITATWRGKGVNGHPPRMDGASLYIWNYTSAAYELLQTSASTEALITLTGTQSGVPACYVGGSDNKTVVLLVVSNDYKKNNPQDNKLYTDYVRLDVRASGSAGILP